MTWFNRHERFGDCKPNEVYIGQNIFAEFTHHGTIRLRNAGRKADPAIVIDHGGVSILAGALQEWKAMKVKP